MTRKECKATGVIGSGCKFSCDTQTHPARPLPTWTEYVQFTHETARYPGVDDRGTVPDYVYYGLRSEVGELCGVLKRHLRDDGQQWTTARLSELKAEIGDILWYCARYALHEQDESLPHNEFWYGNAVIVPGYSGREQVSDLMRSLVGDDYDGVLCVLREMATVNGWTLAEIAADNMAKLRDRKARGVIQGKGDAR